MRQTSVIVQISLLIAGILLIYLYIRPEFLKVNDSQDLIQQYNTAIEEAEDLRSDIERLQQAAEGIASSDKRALERYLPTSPVDHILVQRDILAYVRSRNLSLIDLSAADHGTEHKEDTINSFAFSVNVQGTYNNVKAFISDLERNDYPLRILNLTIAPAGGDIIQADVNLETYYFIGYNNSL